MNARIWKFQYQAAPYLFISPFFVLFTIFLLYPFGYSIYISMNEWGGGGEKTFVGGQNYSDLFRDDTFWQSMWNSVLMFFMYVPPMLLLAVILAIFLNQSWMKYRGFFRTAFFVPNITSVVALSFVFLILMNRQDGLFNTLLSGLGLSGIPWLEDPMWARFSVALLVLYRWTGYNMLLMLAGLQNIPQDMYESARVDGASAWQNFRHITVPLLRRIIVFCTILSTIGTFSLFAEPFILTRGGPLEATLTPVLLLYRESFQNFNFGYSSAIAVCFFALMMVLTFLQLRLDEKD